MRVVECWQPGGQFAALGWVVRIVLIALKALEGIADISDAAQFPHRVRGRTVFQVDEIGQLVRHIVRAKAKAVARRETKPTGFEGLRFFSPTYSAAFIAFDTFLN